MKNAPYLLTIIAIVAIWLPTILITQKLQALELVALNLGVVLMLNYMGRKMFPMAEQEVEVMNKHFNSILIGTVVCNLIAAISLILSFKIGVAVLMVPFLWQAISLPNSALMLPSIRRELEALPEEENNQPSPTN